MSIPAASQGTRHSQTTQSQRTRVVCTIRARSSRKKKDMLAVRDGKKPDPSSVIQVRAHQNKGIDRIGHPGHMVDTAKSNQMDNPSRGSVSVNDRF